MAVECGARVALCAMLLAATLGSGCASEYFPSDVKLRESSLCSLPSSLTCPYAAMARHMSRLVFRPRVRPPNLPRPHIASMLR